LETVGAAATWEGQADVCSLPGERYVLTWGVRSVRESVDEVMELLPPVARALPVRLRQPFFHGDTCLNVVRGAGGRTLLLAHAGAFVETSLSDLERFCA